MSLSLIGFTAVQTCLNEIFTYFLKKLLMLARYSKYVTLKFEYLKNPQTYINNIMKLVTENEVKFIKKINIFDKQERLHFRHKM